MRNPFITTIFYRILRVPVLALPLVAWQPLATAQPGPTLLHSITAVEFLDAIGRTDGTVSLTGLFADGKTRVYQTGDGSTAACRFHKGVLEAVNVGEHLPEWCELELLSAGSQLADGWSVQRVHWTGDVSAARFIVNPAGSRSLHLRVALRLPDSDREPKLKNRVTRVAGSRLRLNLIALLGPEGAAWRSALRLPAQRQ